MKNSMLQRVSNSNEKPGSLKGPAIIFYAISLIVAFIAGGYYERAKAPVAPTATVAEATPEALPTPQEPISPAPLASATPATHFTPPPLITSEPSSTPVRVEKAVAVAPSPSIAASPAPVIAATPSMVASTPPPARQPGAVTVLETVTDIPVKDGGKIVGYINLQPGAQIVPVSVENGQIKFKSGERFAYVPVKSTDMKH